MPKLFSAYRPDGTLDDAALDEAAGLLAAGKLVALPTETVYGLGANALDPAAVRRIFEAKGRPSFNPLIVHVPGIEAARALAAEFPRTAEELAAAFWPGPLTLVLPRTKAIPDVVTGGLDSVALRAPAHPVARELLLRSGVPVAAPSANRFGSVSPTLAEHVLSSLGERIDAVVDGGPCAVGIESTVLDLTGARPRLLRPGGVSAAELRRVVGDLEERHDVLDAGARASPGLLSRHYAPQGETQLLETAGFPAALAALPEDARIGAVVRDMPAPADPRIAAWEKLGSDPARFARELYAAIHRLDAAKCTHVLLEAPPALPAWNALRDRLTRAAGSPDSHGLSPS